MRALQLGVDETREVFLLGTDRRVTLASETQRLTLDIGAGYTAAHARAVADEQYVTLEALTALPDALTRGDFPLALPGKPYTARLRLSVDALTSPRLDA
jgi:galactose mutarotase-like enzyme